MKHIWYAGICIQASSIHAPWLESWAAWERIVVILKADGPAVRILWSIDCNEACVTAAVRTGDRRAERKHAWCDSFVSKTFFNRLKLDSCQTVLPTTLTKTRQTAGWNVDRQRGLPVLPKNLKSQSPTPTLDCTSSQEICQSNSSVLSQHLLEATLLIRTPVNSVSVQPGLLSNTIRHWTLVEK